MKKADRERSIKALNTDLGPEIGAIIQYMHHHVMAEDIESPTITDLFEETAKDEMKHMKNVGQEDQLSRRCTDD